MQKAKVALVVLFGLTVGGCSSSPTPSSDVIGVGNTEYTSLYHYGYNIGCRSAVAKSEGTYTGDVNSMKDEVLDGLDQFDSGWDSGVQSCSDGVTRSMYTVQSK
ncbi:hypothetical protein [Shewanella waksmanii]|uniref:hypothetical protein n=1 Tax=Shewanella waksmanii TaxID=213783 RepID=UPI003735F481